MTIIASWFNNERPEYPAIWTASDTKVVFEIGQGPTAIHQQRATIEASKIFDLNVVCKNLTHEPGRIHFRMTLTFSFAGSTLLAVNTYATLNTILSNLGGGDDAHPFRPDCESILSVALSVLRNHNESIRTSSQIIIAGKCPKTQRLFIGKACSWVEGADVKGDYEVHFNEVGTYKYILIGSHVNEIEEVINQQLAKKDFISSNSYWRTPLTSLTDIIKTNQYDEIGGNVQLAICDMFLGSQLFSVSPDIVVGRETMMKYQNINIVDTIGHYVGECLIAIGGMIIDVDSVDAYAKQRWPELNNQVSRDLQT